ncbi:MAG TPA: presqualene diphosphate synthase HpnD [Novosphingobium sp.]|nr:presqualene diphosphate synthase HpnD [Novosphingobium sp.]HZV11470.1 presqualene diphosphate synthase HpnD [Novosphingobium sp.]
MSATTTMMPADLAAAVSRSSFYAGMRILPRAEREAMFAIYGFCRVVDDIADDQQTPPEARGAALDRWREGVGALYRGGNPGPAAFLAEAVARFDLVEADFIAVIDGMQMDVDEDIRWPDFAKLDLYCDRVASAVGRLSVNIFGMVRAEGVALAHHLGRALQFTNILRDIDEDAGIGRVYLPAEALALAGISPTTPAALVAEPNLDAAARWLAARAEIHFREAGAILAARPRGHLVAPRLMEAAYSRILARLLAQGWQAPRRRIKVSKLALAFSALRFSLFA